MQGDRDGRRSLTPYNLLQHIGDLDLAMRSEGSSYACVGGLPTAVLLDPRTIVDSLRHEIQADPTLELSSLRPNDTVRDIDLVLFTTNKSLIGRVSARTLEAIKNSSPVGSLPPELTVSGFETVDLGLQPWLQFVSQFILLEGRLYLKLGHIVEEIPLSTHMETWSIRYGEQKIDMLHPIAHLMSYRTRSVTGVRPKDRASVTSLEQRLGTVFGADEWTRFESWMRFEHRIATELTLRDALLARSLRRLTLTVGKVILGMAESNPTLVKLALSSYGPIRAITSFGLRKSRPSSRELR